MMDVQSKRLPTRLPSVATSAPGEAPAAPPSAASPKNDSSDAAPPTAAPTTTRPDVFIGIPGPRRSFGQFSVAVPASAAPTAGAAAPAKPQPASSTITFTVQDLTRAPNPARGSRGSRGSIVTDPHAFALKRAQLKKKWKESPTASRRSLKSEELHALHRKSEAATPPKADAADRGAKWPARRVASEPAFFPTIAATPSPPKGRKPSGTN